MTIFQKHEKWLEVIADLNKSADDIVEQRDVCFKWMADRIKKVFEDNGNPVPKIHISARGEEITCSWYDKVELSISKEMILDINMEFDFNRKVYNDGFWRKEIIFYPFGKDLSKE